MVDAEENQHECLIFQIMNLFSIHSMTQESPTHSLVYDGLWTHGWEEAQKNTRTNYQTFGHHSRFQQPIDPL